MKYADKPQAFRDGMSAAKYGQSINSGPRYQNPEDDYSWIEGFRYQHRKESMVGVMKRVRWHCYSNGIAYILVDALSQIAVVGSEEKADRLMTRGLSLVGSYETGYLKSEIEEDIFYAIENNTAIPTLIKEKNLASVSQCVRGTTVARSTSPSSI